jgi:hypothetical protein
MLSAVACREVAKNLGKGKTQRSIEIAYQAHLKLMDRALGETKRRSKQLCSARRRYAKIAGTEGDWTIPVASLHELFALNASRYATGVRQPQHNRLNSLRSRLSAAYKGLNVLVQREGPRTSSGRLASATWRPTKWLSTSTIFFQSNGVKTESSRLQTMTASSRRRRYGRAVAKPPD